MTWTSDPGRVERLLEVTRRLATPIELPEMLEHVIEAGRAVLDAERGSVLLYDAESDELVSSVATGGTEIRLSTDRGLAGACARSRRIVNVPDAYADPRFNRDIDRATGFRTRCLLTVPLLDPDGALVGVLQLLNKRDGSFGPDDEAVATVLAAQCAVAIQRVGMIDRLVETRKMERELELAREIQTALLPGAIRPPAGYDVVGLSRPADETGGDTFDLVEQGDRGMMLLLGDATGHGVGPALSVTQVRAMFRLAARVGLDLDATFRHINDQIAQDLDARRFVAAFVGHLDATRHVVSYHSAGQGPLLHWHREDGRAEWLAPTTAPMGLMECVGDPTPGAMHLAPGDVLALITDGVYETENAAGEMFGRERVAERIAAGAAGSMADLAGRLLEASASFRGAARQDDDITIVLVKRG